MLPSQCNERAEIKYKTRMAEAEIAHLVRVAKDPSYAALRDALERAIETFEPESRRPGLRHAWPVLWAMLLTSAHELHPVHDAGWEAARKQLVKLDVRVTRVVIPNKTHRAQAAETLAAVTGMALRMWMMPAGPRPGLPPPSSPSPSHSSPE